MKIVALFTFTSMVLLLIGCDSNVTPDKACERFGEVSVAKGETFDAEAKAKCTLQMTKIVKDHPPAWSCMTKCVKDAGDSVIEGCVKGCYKIVFAAREAKRKEETGREIKSKYATLTIGELVAKAKRVGWKVISEKRIRNGWRLFLARKNLARTSGIEKAVMMLVNAASPSEAKLLANDFSRRKGIAASSGGSSKVVIFRSMSHYSQSYASSDMARIVWQRI